MIMTIDTASLKLRPIALDDAARVHEWASMPEACRYQTWGPNSWSDTLAFVQAAVQAWSAEPQTQWHWMAEDPAGTAYGMGQLKRHSSSRAEIAYSVHVDYWGQGVGTAIARLLIDWAFESWPEIERVEATCDPRNIGSERILRRTGMTYEGTLRHTMLIRDGWRDSKLFSILRDEWASL